METWPSGAYSVGWGWGAKNASRPFTGAWLAPPLFISSTHSLPTYAVCTFFDLLSFNDLQKNLLHLLCKVTLSDYSARGGFSVSSWEKDEAGNRGKHTMKPVSELMKFNLLYLSKQLFPFRYYSGDTFASWELIIYFHLIQFLRNVFLFMWMHMCMRVFVWMYVTWVKVPAEARRGWQDSCNWNSDSWKTAWCGRWEPNSSPLREQQVLITTDPPLKPHHNLN